MFMTFYKQLIKILLRPSLKPGIKYVYDLLKPPEKNTFTTSFKTLNKSLKIRQLRKNTKVFDGLSPFPD